MSGRFKMNEIFDDFVKEYEKWYSENQNIFECEIKAIKKVLPVFKKGIEIGVGTGIFAKALGIKDGLDPSNEMTILAKERGINVINGKAEKMEIQSESYDFVLLTTTLCFLENVKNSFEEINRILEYEGILIIAFIDKNSFIGKEYSDKKATSKFYIEANFYATNEVLEILKKSKFEVSEIVQTLSKSDDFQIKDGFGEGSYIVIKAKKIKKVGIKDIFKSIFKTNKK